MKEDWIYKRGDLYYANLNPYFGSEQGGTRPVLVLQNNVGNFFCPTLIVAPLTSKWIKKKELPTHYALESVPELGLKSVVLLEQIKTIDKRRVLSYIGRVSREEMRAIDDALQVSLDIHIPEEMEAPSCHLPDKGGVFMFEARIAELNRFNEQNPVSYDKRTYTVDEIQDILGISRPTAYNLVKQGVFHSVRVGGHIRISKKSFDDWLDHTDE